MARRMHYLLGQHHGPRYSWQEFSHWQEDLVTRCGTGSSRLKVAPVPLQPHFSIRSKVVARPPISRAEQQHWLPEVMIRTMAQCTSLPRWNSACEDVLVMLSIHLLVFFQTLDNDNMSTNSVR